MLLATFSGNAPIVPAGYLFHNTQSVVSRSVPNSYHLNVDIRTIRRTNFESLIEEAGGIAPLDMSDLFESVAHAVGRPMLKMPDLIN